ncbi:hypothetical protein [Leptospira wolffii]|uniref:hypothetical protein n=1 Tax=Leptospira wolffii TaxID=409998 RepID=UPI00058D6D40|nr:hypothetical protein [Leptospira wolffii]
MKSLKILIILILGFEMIDCGEHSPSGCEGCLVMLLSGTNAKIQIRNRSDIGNAVFYIQDGVFSVNSSGTTLQYGIDTNKSGSYRLVADIGGELFNFPNFDFSSTINDGAFITTPGTINVGECNLFDGPTGTIIPDGCL